MINISPQTLELQNFWQVEVVSLYFFFSVEQFPPSFWDLTFLAIVSGWTRSNFVTILGPTLALETQSGVESELEPDNRMDPVCGGRNAETLSFGQI